MSLNKKIIASFEKMLYWPFQYDPSDNNSDDEIDTLYDVIRSFGPPLLDRMCVHSFVRSSVRPYCWFVRNTYFSDPSHCICLKFLINLCISKSKKSDKAGFLIETKKFQEEPEGTKTQVFRNI